MSLRARPVRFRGFGRGRLSWPGRKGRERRFGAGPEWLPSGALAYADFANGHYYFDGAEHTLGEMFESNVNVGDFNPSQVQNGVGLVIDDQSSENLPALTSAAATAFLSTGATVAADFTFPAYGDFRNFFADETFASFWLLQVDVNAGQIEDGDQDADTGSLSMGAHKIAFTISPMMMAASFDGGAVTHFVPGNPPDPAWQIIYFQLRGTFRTLAFYAPKTNGELPGLSD